jgi:hypothetical protein
MEQPTHSHHFVLREMSDFRHQVILSHVTIPLLHRLHIQIFERHKIKRLGYRLRYLVAKIQALSPDFIVD